MPLVRPFAKIAQHCRVDPKRRYAAIGFRIATRIDDQEGSHEAFRTRPRGQSGPHSRHAVSRRVAASCVALLPLVRSQLDRFFGPSFGPGDENVARHARLHGRIRSRRSRPGRPYEIRHGKNDSSSSSRRHGRNHAYLLLRGPGMPRPRPAMPRFGRGVRHFERSAHPRLGRAIHRHSRLVLHENGGAVVRRSVVRIHAGDLLHAVLRLRDHNGAASARIVRRLSTQRKGSGGERSARAPASGKQGLHDALRQDALRYDRASRIHAFVRMRHHSPRTLRNRPRRHALALEYGRRHHHHRIGA